MDNKVTSVQEKNGGSTTGGKKQRNTHAHLAPEPKAQGGGVGPDHSALVKPVAHRVETGWFVVSRVVQSLMD